MNYCSNCGASVIERIPDGDNRLRHMCDDCGVIHYVNPKIVAGCLPVWEDKVLMCRRAIEPRSGLWTLPAGFMELGETTQAAAARETLEEAEARVEIQDLYCYLNIPRINQVYVLFLGRMLTPDFAPGIESLEVALLREEEVPWDQIAFSSMEVTLRHFFEDRRSGRFITRVVDLDHRPR